MAKKKKFKFRTDQEIVDDCNALARMFCKGHGYQVPKGYRFDKASHPQEQGMWSMAVTAFEFIEGTTVEDALNNIEDGEE